MRIGSDLIISGDGQKFVVGNYFKGDARPVLATKDGATLAGHIVDALTGHVHYAQATAPAQAGQIIGHVQKMSGSATVIRNGVSVELRVGDAVQKGDVVQTGSDSSIGMTFVDGSVFGMTSNARMVLNEMIFDPNGSSNSSLISLVQGTITFVAGQTAKNGNMRVETPVATMGIRGTAVLVEIGANDGPTKFSVLVEPDGHTGSYNLYDKTTGQLIGTVSQAGQVTYVSVSGIGQPPTAIEQLKTLADQESAKALIQEVFKLYFPNYNPDNSNPKSQKTGFGSPGDNINPFAFYKPLQDLGPPKVITIPGVGVDPVTGQPNPSRTFYNTKAQFSALPVFADQAFAPTIRVFNFKDVVKIDDPDIGSAPFYDIGVPFVAGSAIIKSAVSTVGYLSEAFLKPLLNINQTTGIVSFDREQFNFLDDGQTVTFKIQVTATSGPDTGIVEIPITITGANDAPTIVGGTATIITGAVKEDVPVTSGHIEADGTITFKDVDLTDAHTATVELTSTTSSALPGFVSGAGNAPTTTKIGTFTIDPVSESTTDTNNQGSVGWHFSLDDNDPTLQSLAEGQTITQVYTITIKDDNGVPVTQTVTITITGTNDAPVLTADASIHQADEVPDTTGAPNSVVDVATGTLAFADVDLSDTHTASAALQGASSVVWSGGSYNDIPQATRDALNGAVTASVSENNTDTNNQGSISWEFKLPDHLFDFLAKGQTLTLIYDVTVTDNNGLSSTKQITVQVGAANDQPVISVIDNGAAVKEDVDPVGGILKDHGSVTFTDTDLTDTHTAHVAYNNDAAGSAGVSPALALALATALTVPSSPLAAGDHDFNWDFALDTNLIQYLAEGETITATYTITVKDNSSNSNDTSVAKTVTVTITGTNDTPTITSGTAAASATVPELTATTGSATLDPAGGTVTFADVDLTDTHQVTQSSAIFDWSGGTLTSIQINDLTNASARTLVPHDSTGTGSGSVDWTYKITDSALDFLADGQTLTVTYDITVADYHNGVATGTSTSQTVTVTYTGSNDEPVVSGTVSDALVVEDAPVSVLNALANASDVDDGATLSVVNVPGVDVPGSLPAGVTYDAVNHTFTLDPNNAAYQHLAEGATTTVTVNYGVSDGIVTTPTPASVSWTITGTNDAPVVSGVVSDPSAVEDGSTRTLDALANASDVDDGATLSVVNVPGVDVPGSLPAGVTYDAVNHTFTLDPNNAAYQHLAEGATTTVTVSYSVSDGIVTTPTPASVSWTITGTNDAPVVSGVVSDPSAVEDGSTRTLDALANASDVDDGSTLSVVNVPGTLPDGVTYDAVHHTFTLDPGNAAYQHLAEGATTTVTVSYSVSDGIVTTPTPASVSWTITGTNDAPTIDANGFQTAQSSGTTTISNLSVADPDASDTFTVTATADHGTVTFSPSSGDLATVNGALGTGIAYTPTGTPATDKVALTVTDAAGAHDTVNFIFNVSGTGPVTLQGTSDKDVFFATGYQDTFVFAPSSNQDVITNGFQAGTDKIDLQAFSSINATALADILTNADHTGGDTLLHINGTTDTLLLKGVAALNASDFILHA
ncbi:MULTISPECIES: VCBS domain-containing protein [unclassified Afipia]|uniref:VCBS domain-containing protein n=5 Tax=Afipia TaxID=1033 RepID=UPI000688DC86|nr:MULTISPECIES: VCBS domain-containing protein [unclassified Afipia]